MNNLSPFLAFLLWCVLITVYICLIYRKNKLGLAKILLFVVSSFVLTAIGYIGLAAFFSRHQAISFMALFLLPFIATVLAGFIWDKPADSDRAVIK